jgi:hypothetical protein
MNNSNLDLSLNEKKAVRCEISILTNKALVKSFEEVFNKHDNHPLKKYLARSFHTLTECDRLSLRESIYWSPSMLFHSIY